ncbi:DNA-directed RNA polymerase subunit beta [Brevibacillus sp. LEMMJ03]|uniref:DUF5819 family protein n=1 Tax=Brevibacillus sp. LEMMJ03 TaxID=2595056 RepID=UPI00117D2068|nr:DUF5819 family protein [Brevibacillus sp. LEMMJ03]TRY27830.1 DNA-directed RNA polymerase subunit beta [Brevibacillus sp. LEMMJ03]
MELGKWQKRLLACFPVLLVALMLWHFSMILLHVLPFNPLTNKWRDIVDGYTNPIFSQNWHLFAPNPVSHTNTIYIQAKVKDASGRLVESDWVDITTPLITANWEHRFSPINRIMRFGVGAFTQAFHQDDVINLFEEKKQKRNKEDLKLPKEDLELLDEYRKQGVHLLYRYGFSNVPKYIAGQDVDSIRLRVLIRASKPFSERHNPNYQHERQYVEFDWQRYEPVVPSI